MLVELAQEDKAQQSPETQESPKTQTKPVKKKRTAKQYAISFFIRLGITAAAVTLLLVFVAGVYVNHTNSAYPMIKDGDLCLTYKLAELAPGDAVAYEQSGEMRFGRVVALESDTVEIRDDCIFVNGRAVLEDTVFPTTAEGSAISYPYKVPKDSVFVLNDFRSDNSDSRTLGGIKLEDCRGKVVFIMRRRGI